MAGHTVGFGADFGVTPDHRVKFTVLPDEVWRFRNAQGRLFGVNTPQKLATRLGGVHVRGVRQQYPT